MLRQHKWELMPCAISCYVFAVDSTDSVPFFDQLKRPRAGSGRMNRLTTLVAPSQLRQIASRLKTNADDSAIR